MATTVDTLLVRIEADLKGLRQDLTKVEQSTKRSSQNMQRSLNGVDKSTQTLAKGFKSLVVAAGAFFGGGALIRTIRTFEDLQATLKAVTGSSKLAAQSFKLITDFTKTTTFQLDEVTGAFITLVNAGIAPTEDALRDIGNLAAARGKDIRQVAQAIFNATTGEMEMLKQLGIVARVEGDKLNVTYKGVTETIDRSGASIVEFIRNLSQAEFPNAIEERANTLSGAISNLEDGISLFFMEVGNAGFRQALTDLVKFFIEGTNGSQSLATVLGKSLAAAVRTINRALEFLADNLRNITIAISVFLAVNFATRLAAMAAGLYTLSKALVTARIAQVALNKAMLKNPFILATSAALILAAEMGALDEILKQLTDKFDDVFDLSEEGSEEIGNLNDEIAKLGQSAEASGKVLETDFTKTLTKLKEETKMAKAELMGMSPALISALESAGGLSNIRGNTLARPQDEKEATTLGVGLTGKQISQLEHQISLHKKETTALDRKNQAIEESKSFLNSLKTEKEQIIETQQALNIAYNEFSAISHEEYTAALKETEVQLMKLEPAFQRMERAVHTFADGMSNALADAFISGKLSMESLADVFRNVVKQMIAEAIRAAIIRTLMKAFTGGFGGGGSIGSGSNSMQFTSASDSFAGGGRIPARASGGPVLVGERGPELFIPHSAGVVRNNHDTKNILGGGQPTIVNQSFNIETGVADTVRAEILTLMPRIKAETVRAVTDSKRRGSGISKVFA